MDAYKGPLRAAANGVGPALPHSIASTKSKSVDEVVSLMNRMPLFMTSIDAESAEDNPELEALRALQYEGSRREIAQGFREKGNEMAKAKRWGDGKEYYTKALAALRMERKMEDADGELEDEMERQIEEAAYSNRALCHLELRNYRSTTLDCAVALRLNSKNVKAYYRSSRALLALRKLPEALDAAEHGLAIESSNTSLKSLFSDITAQQTASSATDLKRQKREAKAKREEMVLKAALTARGVKVRMSTKPPEMEDAVIRLVPDPESPSSLLTFPVLLLYPEHGQTDLIKSVGETETLGQHLEEVFPVPWDEARQYTKNGVELFMETATGGLIKIGKKVSLLLLLGEGKVEVVDGLVRVWVVPKTRVTSWVEEMKKRMGKST